MLQPLGSRVLVEPSSAEEKSAGGIYLPEKAQEKPREGKVVAVGPGKIMENGEREPMPVAVGDIVVYQQYGGSEIKVDNKEYLLIDQGSLLAVKS
jgi:chaperonin GroES